MGNKLEAVVCAQNYDLIEITETCSDNLDDWDIDINAFLLTFSQKVICQIMNVISIKDNGEGEGRHCAKSKGKKQVEDILDKMHVFKAAAW